MASFHRCKNWPPEKTTWPTWFSWRKWHHFGQNKKGLFIDLEGSLLWLPTPQSMKSMCPRHLPTWRWGSWPMIYWGKTLRRYLHRCERSMTKEKKKVGKDRHSVSWTPAATSSSGGITVLDAPCGSKAGPLSTVPVRQTKRDLGMYFWKRTSDKMTIAEIIGGLYWHLHIIFSSTPSHVHREKFNLLFKAQHYNQNMRISGSNYWSLSKAK